MKAFILAAGLGTRLRPLTLYKPKPLVPVLNIPAIFYALHALKDAGINKAVCNLHYRSESIIRVLEEHGFFGMDLTISEEEKILGTGGGLKKCEQLLADDDFVLINSDIVADFDIKALAEHHRSSGAGATLALVNHPRAKVIGDVGIDSHGVHDFKGKRGTGLSSNLIYGGAAIISPGIFDHLSNDCSSIVDTGFYGLIDTTGIAYRIHQGFWHDIGTMESLWTANILGSDEISRISSRMQHSLGLSPTCFADDALIPGGTHISASVIGVGCSIGKNARIERTLVMPGTVVENDAMLRDCIAWNGGTINVD